MKKSKLMCAIMAIVMAAGLVFWSYSRLQCNLSDKWCSNVEALAQIEGSHILCDSGTWGRCLRKVNLSQTKWFCEWTGYQEDYYPQPW